MAKEIPLTQGKVAIIDDEDLETINQHKWYALKHKKTYYAVRHTKQRGLIRMHRQILIKPQSLFEFESADDDGFKKCWALENLQPLSAKENWKKGNKYRSET